MPYHWTGTPAWEKKSKAQVQNLVIFTENKTKPLNHFSPTAHSASCACVPVLPNQCIFLTVAAYLCCCFYSLLSNAIPTRLPLLVTAPQHRRGTRTNKSASGERLVPSASVRPTACACGASCRETPPLRPSCAERWLRGATMLIQTCSRAVPGTKPSVRKRTFTRHARATYGSDSHL